MRSMPRILITGAGGFVSAHLIDHLAEKYPRASLLGVGRFAVSGRDPQRPRIVYRRIDLSLPHALPRLMKEFRPTQIYHLAGYSSVVRSFEEPFEALRDNTHTAVSLFESVLAAGLKPRVLLVSTGQVYGRTFAKKARPAESDPVEPVSPYALSKLMMEQVGLYYFKNHAIPVLAARPLNHIGPGQSADFSIPAFARQFAQMTRGRVCRLKAGNVDVRRDFSDVRDIVRGYAAIMEKGRAGEAYNLGSGRAVTLRRIIRGLERVSGIRVKIETGGKPRPGDLPRMQVSIRKAGRETGWRPRIPLEMTLRDIYLSFKRR